MLNQAILVGRIATDTTDGIKLAIPRTYKNENGEYDTDIIPVKLTGSIKNNVTEYCKMGDIVGVKGRIANEDGHIVISAEKVTFLSSKNSD